MKAALDSLPGALLVSEGEREALASLLVQQTDGNGQLGIPCTTVAAVLIEAGYRKITALDRKQLVEEIAKALLETADDDPKCREWADSVAKGLLSRLEATTDG